MADERKQWEQIEGEPIEAYRRFCAYLNLGQIRTLEKAYLASKPIAKKSQKKPQIPGNWIDDSKKWNWVERAAYWDIAQMAEQGQRVITQWVRSLEIITQKSLVKLESADLEPQEWKEAVDAICRIGSFIPAESVKQLQDSVTANEQPRIGASADGNGAP